ncbi:MobA/MobL family protein [Bradyrhizobium sp. BR 1432]|uniref:MobA/MobL family protein n=1 Tax=Bradyrhizobium sp. BR 1432 TaxID=3447966 RepID=UPI003EE4D280
MKSIALMRQSVLEQVLSRGQVADGVYHDEAAKLHIHLTRTLRPLTQDGFEPKRVAIIDDDGQPTCRATGVDMWQRLAILIGRPDGPQIHR